MKKWTMTWVVVAACSLFASCTTDERAVRAEAGRSSLELTFSGTCEDHCSSKSAGDCWCDEQCAEYGDCCADKFEYCGGAAPVGSCAGSCGEQSETGACWCDEACAAYGDCCEDVGEYCRFDPPGPESCFSSDDCESGHVCSVELGDCQPPPGCEEGQPCPAVCAGECVPNFACEELPVCPAIALECGPGEYLSSPACGCPSCEPLGCDLPDGTQVLGTPEQCIAMLFMCEEGQEMFFNECGCGCMPAGGNSCDDVNLACPECYSGDVTCSYGGFSETEASCGTCQAEAALTRALCEAGVEDVNPEDFNCSNTSCLPVTCDLYCDYGFASDENGCESCVCNPGPECTYPPNVTVVGSSPSECALMDLSCPEDEGYWSNACGCGCGSWGENECSSNADCSGPEHCVDGECTLNCALVLCAAPPQGCVEWTSAECGCYTECTEWQEGEISCHGNYDCPEGQACTGETQIWCVTTPCIAPKFCEPVATNSCVDACGGPADDQSCYCDPSCETYGDCCGDYEQVCGSSTPVPNDCVTTGCSGQICDEDDVVSTCEFLPEYACFANASCERQADGDCGWTQDAALVECLAEYN